MKSFSGIYLLLTLAATVAVMFLRDKWATSIPELMSFGLAATWIVRILAGRAKARLSPALLPLAGLLALGAIQLATGSTVYAWPTRVVMLYWAGNLAVLFCGLQFLDERRERERFLRLLLYFGFGVALLSTMQALTSQGKIYWVLTTEYSYQAIFGPFLYRNQYAAFMELILPLALYGAVTNPKRRILYLAIATTIYASVVACASRAGFVLATVELGLVPLVSARGRMFSRKQLVNGSLVMVAMLLWMAVPAGPELLISKFGAADPFQQRREFNEASWRMIRDRPLVGFGLGNWPTVYPGYATFDDDKYTNQAHNDWAQWTVEGGVPLLAMMLFLAAWAVRGGLRTGWGLGVPIVFLHCFVDYPIQRPGVAVLFFLLLAGLESGGTPAPAQRIRHES